jgi:hypothetical protein
MDSGESSFPHVQPNVEILLSGISNRFLALSGLMLVAFALLFCLGFIFS